jgi:hypothetical protein
VHLLQDLKVVCGKEGITIGAFATDGDPGYDPLHEEQFGLNIKSFEKDPSVMPEKRHYRVSSNRLAWNPLPTLHEIHPVG